MLVFLRCVSVRNPPTHRREELIVTGGENSGSPSEPASIVDHCSSILTPRFGSVYRSLTIASRLRRVKTLSQERRAEFGPPFIVAFRSAKDHIMTQHRIKRASFRGSEKQVWAAAYRLPRQPQSRRTAQGSALSLRYRCCLLFRICSRHRASPGNLS